MEKVLKFIFVVMLLYFVIASAVFVSMGGLKEANVTGFGIAYILVGGMLLLKILFFLIPFAFLYQWLFERFSPLQYSQKNSLIIFRENEVLFYYSFCGIFFKQVLSLDNQEIKNTQLYSLERVENSYIWKTQNHEPSKKNALMLQKILKSYFRESNHSFPYLLNGKNLFLSPIYTSLVERIGKKEFEDFICSSNPQFHYVSSAKWLPLQKNIIKRERWRTFSTFIIIFIVTVLSLVLCYGLILYFGINNKVGLYRL